MKYFLNFRCIDEPIVKNTSTTLQKYAVCVRLLNIQPEPKNESRYPFTRYVNGFSLMKISKALGRFPGTHSSGVTYNIIRIIAWTIITTSRTKVANVDVTNDKLNKNAIVAII